MPLRRTRPPAFIAPNLFQTNSEIVARHLTQSSIGQREGRPSIFRYLALIRPPLMAIGAVRIGVSIHAPHARRRDIYDIVVNKGVFRSTPPTGRCGGADATAKSKRFNPCPHMGGDQHKREARQRRQLVSIHASARGGDCAVCQGDMYPLNGFRSTPPPDAPATARPLPPRGVSIHRERCFRPDRCRPGPSARAAPS